MTELTFLVVRPLLLVPVVAVVISCAGPDPTVECRRWVREGCVHYNRCGEIADVEKCVQFHEGLDEETKLCPATLSDPYCADLGDDFALCADRFKSSACGTPNIELCTLHTSTRSQCDVPDRFVNAEDL